jgi:Ca2+-binding EF-hand superfamily protein
MIEKFDLDKDGKLNPEEIKQAREYCRDEHKEELLKKYDKNGDGKLSDTEMDRMEADRIKNVKEELIKEYDKNGNGRLDSSEKEQIKTDAKLQPGRFPWLCDPRPHPLKELVR